MNSELTEIGFVLDRSGSMTSMAAEAIGGFNAFLASQQKLPGDAHLTLVLFDHEYLVACDGVPIKGVQPLNSHTYVPRGTTALWDAIGRTVNTIGERLDKTPEPERPAKVIIAILTDGLENASQEFGPKAIHALITHQREKYSWDFVFLGANQDAILVGESLGLAACCSVTFDEGPGGPSKAFNAVSQYVGTARIHGTRDYAALKKAAKKS
jgi:hypothetical protein